jgi:hypothetical protein
LIVLQPLNNLRKIAAPLSAAAAARLVKVEGKDLRKDRPLSPQWVQISDSPKQIFSSSPNTQRANFPRPNTQTKVINPFPVCPFVPHFHDDNTHTFSN